MKLINLKEQINIQYPLDQHYKKNYLKKNHQVLIFENLPLSEVPICIYDFNYSPKFSLTVSFTHVRETSNDISFNTCHRVYINITVFLLSINEISCL